MTTDELKGMLINAHLRDRKLTIVGFSIVAIIIIVLIGIQVVYKPIPQTVFYNASSENQQNNTEYFNYLKIIIPLFLLGMLSYPVFKIYKIGIRKKLINTFITSMNNGEIATRIDQRTVHKIIIPLIKIKLKLYPVEYVTVILNGDAKKVYDLPIPIEVIPHLKAILSGADVAHLNKAWFELYGEEEVDHSTTKLKSVDEFKYFFENELKTDLTVIDKERNDSKKKYFLYLIPVVSIVGGWMVFQYFMLNGRINLSGQTLIIGFAIFFGVFYSVYFLFFAKKNKNNLGGTDFGHKFKTQIFNRMINFINPGFHYVLHGHLSLPEVLATGIFASRQYVIEGNDQIIGNHNGVPFQLCDLSLHYKKNFSKENDQPDEVFMGQVFIARFNKKFNHELYLVPRKASKLGFGNNDINEYLDTTGEKTQLEDPEFMKRFNVYCSDQLEARYILSPALMERLKNLEASLSGSLFISFKDDRISILNNSRKNNFEPSMFKSIIANDLIIDFYQELIQQLEIIDSLKLNVKIWK